MDINFGGIDFYVWKEPATKFHGYHLYAQVHPSSKLVYKGDIVLDNSERGLMTTFKIIQNIFANNGKHLITFAGMDDECYILRLNIRTTPNTLSPYHIIEVECKAEDFDTRLMVKILRNNIQLTAKLEELSNRVAKLESHIDQ